MLDRYRTAALTLDAATAGLAAVVAVGIRFGSQASTGYLLAPLLLPLAWIAAVGWQRGYERRFLAVGPEEYRRVLHAGLVLFALIAVLSYSSNSSISRAFVLLSVPFTVVVALVGRHLLRAHLRRTRSAGRALHRVVVLGRADSARSLLSQFEAHPTYGLRAVAVCLPDHHEAVDDVGGVPVLGGFSDVIEAVRATGADTVAVVSHPDLSGQALRRLSWTLEEQGVDLVVSPGIVEVAGPRLSIRPVDGLSLLHLERPTASGGSALAKAVLDRTLGAALLVACTPLLLLIGLAVRLGDPGPALFRQIRVGAAGREFTVYKFRTMVVDAEARRAEVAAVRQDAGNDVLFKLRQDPRITRVGAVLRRCSLDELPQLINVVRGEMSLVGPRPPLPAEVARYDGDAARRLRMKPGMTGLWQVSGRSDLNWEQSLRLDLRYVDNWSVLLDLTILWRTARAVLDGRGAY